MPDLKLNTTKVGRLLFARGVLEGLLHPSIVSPQESIQGFLRETDAFVRLLEILWTDAIVVDERKHISIDNNLSKFLHQIGCECGMSMLRLMEISTVWIEPNDVGKGVNMVM